MGKLHYITSTNLGLLQTNMNWKCQTDGPQYHWIKDIHHRMGLPKFGGVSDIITAHNEAAQSMRQYKQKEETIRHAQIALARHRGLEQRERQKWAKQNKACHDYRGDDNYDYCITDPAVPIPRAHKRLQPKKLLPDQPDPYAWNNSDSELDDEPFDEWDDYYLEQALEASMYASDSRQSRKQSGLHKLCNTSLASSVSDEVRTSGSHKVQQSLPCGNADSDDVICSGSHMHTDPPIASLGSPEPTEQWSGVHGNGY